MRAFAALSLWIWMNLELSGPGVVVYTVHGTLTWALSSWLSGDTPRLQLADRRPDQTVILQRILWGYYSQFMFFFFFFFNFCQGYTPPWVQVFLFCHLFVQPMIFSHLNSCKNSQVVSLLTLVTIKVCFPDISQNEPVKTHERLTVSQLRPLQCFLSCSVSQPNPSSCLLGPCVLPPWYPCDLSPHYPPIHLLPLATLTSP